MILFFLIPKTIEELLFLIFYAIAIIKKFKINLNNKVVFNTTKIFSNRFNK